MIAHTLVIDELTSRLASAYGRLPIGEPDGGGHPGGPARRTVRRTTQMQGAIEQALAEGGKLVVGGGRELEDEAAGAYYVRPAIVRIDEQTDVVRQETFAPLLYVLPYDELDRGDRAQQRGAPGPLVQHLHLRPCARPSCSCPPVGSDCGIVNVNVGTSGAEIGGAFGGEKETGGGRESGSDAWKAYMRRATNTVNYSGELPLAQGVDFTV